MPRAAAACTVPCHAASQRRHQPPKLACLHQRDAFQRGLVPQPDGAVPGGRGQAGGRDRQGAHGAGVPLKHLPRRPAHVEWQAAGGVRRGRRALPHADKMVAGAAGQQLRVRRQAAHGGAVPAAEEDGGPRVRQGERSTHSTAAPAVERLQAVKGKRSAATHLTARSMPLSRSQARTVRSTPPVNSRPSCGTRQHALTAAPCPASASCAGRPSQQRARSSCAA